MLCFKNPVTKQIKKTAACEANPKKVHFTIAWFSFNKKTTYRQASCLLFYPIIFIDDSCKHLQLIPLQSHHTLFFHYHQYRDEEHCVYHIFYSQHQLKQ